MRNLKKTHAYEIHRTDVLITLKGDNSGQAFISEDNDSGQTFISSTPPVYLHTMAGQPLVLQATELDGSEFVHITLSVPLHLLHFQRTLLD